MIAASRMTKKHQATIPATIRRMLDLKSGDLIGFELNADRIVLKKAEPLDGAYAQAIEATLSEWSSVADEEAFRDL